MLHRDAPVRSESLASSAPCSRYWIADNVRVELKGDDVHFTGPCGESRIMCVQEAKRFAKKINDLIQQWARS